MLILSHHLHHQWHQTTAKLVMTRYIENIDISFSISIYCIVSYRRKTYWLFQYIAIQTYPDISEHFWYYSDIYYKFFTTLHERKQSLQMWRVNGVVSKLQSPRDTFYYLMKHRPTALLSDYVLFLCLYKLNILIIIFLKYWYRCRYRDHSAAG